MCVKGDQSFVSRCSDGHSRILRVWRDKGAGSKEQGAGSTLLSCIHVCQSTRELVSALATVATINAVEIVKGKTDNNISNINNECRRRQKRNRTKKKGKSRNINTNQELKVKYPGNTMQVTENQLI
ncbi:hypothetical protein E2C01_098268 [Portunus trituberculatus]|uniref:Uncharacterized protein n=1 Tax=Portunus trituberculatus TaxID=210409 RepID=A0A5B7JXD8_PORTR|nr:hypothetical protein [Portunus trituberculatus]